MHKPQEIPHFLKGNNVSRNDTCLRWTRLCGCIRLRTPLKMDSYYLPSEAEWLPAYLRELTTFPNGKHDDQTDSTSQALDWAKQNYHTYPLHEFYKLQLLRERLG
jgi:hypothetical protein